ncbi:superoxide dismutase family protein [Gemmatimonas sp.]|uniref:superoxide dismutase family protein n=1 Tax=Gemmatimonas sp. TaxID=1962908 RepID=UPI00286E6291|nr:superoxide dismutase family protein [Gemmatimonas sp.]
MRSASPRLARRASAALGVALLFAACSKAEDASAKDSAMAADSAASLTLDSTATAGASAGVTARVVDAGGRELGVLTFADAGAAISVDGTLRGLPPGVHGMHIHAVGRCDAPDFASAGPHWSPTPKQHGSTNEAGPHHGDLMNVTVGADSSAVVKMSTPAGSLRGENPLLDADGAAIVIHATADDYKTDPSGNSGARIACGVASGS